MMMNMIIIIIIIIATTTTTTICTNFTTASNKKLRLHPMTIYTYKHSMLTHELNCIFLLDYKLILLNITLTIKDLQE
jgi:hypothetical protein